MSALNEYRQLMTKLLAIRHQNIAAEVEDAVLDEMDLVWHRMSIEERNDASIQECKS